MNKLRPWYPKIGDSDKAWNYIYLDTLFEDNKAVYDKARNEFNITISSLIGAGVPAQLEELRVLAQREEKKENDLLQDFARKGAISPIDAANKIRGFNKMYQNKKIFERNLKKILAVADGGKQGRIDISSSFTSYLQTAISEYFKSFRSSKLSISKEALLEITRQALIKAFSSADDRRKKDSPHSYEDLVPEIEAMTTTDPFIQEVFEIYFGTSWKKIMKEISGTKAKGRKMNKAETQKMITNSYGAGGLVFEKVLELTARNLGQNVKHTGGTLQKADLVILHANVELPDMGDIDSEVASKRAQFVTKYQEFYNNLEQTTGHIVEINAKNYNLAQPNFQQKGFLAQGGTTIKNFEAMLRAYNYDSARTDRLIFALTNIGPDALSEDTTKISQNIALLIAYFLFDDIDMDQGLSLNAVHLLNLDGMYIPLSCFLFAAYDALKDFNSAADDLVSVHYNPSSVNYEKDPTPGSLTKQKWEDTVKVKQDQSSLSIYFFRNFPSYVQKHLNNFILD